MDLDMPAPPQHTLRGLDSFIDREILPLQHSDDNMRFFDHRREWARTDWERQGLPSKEWEALLGEARRRADAAGWYRWALPRELGGHDAGSLEMAGIREHLRPKGLGLPAALQNTVS